MPCGRSRSLEKERKRLKEIKEIKMNSVAALFIFHALRFPPPTSAHHIVFEEIRVIAGALLYIHAVIPVNIFGLNRAAHIFCSQVASIRQHYNIIQADIEC
jgi:hypothetical protein